MPIQVFGNNKVGLTELGGIAIKLTNETGAPSVKGTIVIASNVSGQDDSFEVAGADEYQPIGIVYEDGIADGSECWVVINGVAQVLLKDATTSTTGNWVRTSDVAGRADVTLAAPPGGGIPELDQHMQEVGHSLETKSANTDVLCKVALHFN